MPSIRTLFKHSMGRDTVLSIVEDEPFRFAPGTVMSYSNTGYFLLGYIIENASNQSYESYLEEHILGPAGMVNTYYCDEKSVNRNKAHGYERHPKKGFLHKDFEVHIWPYSAGSLCSTVRDLVKWNQELHNGDILADSLYQEMITPGQLADGTKVLYGMGLGVYTDNGLPVIGHGGAISGYISESRYYPDQDLTIVALQNTTSPPPPQALSESLAQIVIGTEEDKKKNSYSGNLNDLTGRYTGPVRGRILDLTIEAKDGKLIMRMTGREAEGDTLQHVSGLTWKWQDKQFITFGKVSDQVVELRSTARGIGLYTGYYILRRVM